MSRLSFFEDLLSTISERGRSLLGQGGPVSGTAPLLLEQCDRLMSRRGEASGVAIASQILSDFDRLDDEGKLAFFISLVRRYSPDPEKVGKAAEAYARNQDAANQAQLMQVTQSPRQELFRRLNLAPGGTAALVAMREILLTHLAERPALRAVDADLAHLFSSWFNRGFLILRQIDWKTPAHMLEMLIQHEAVHAINGWDDLRRRLQPSDRRCFGFFHPALGDAPLIFVEVALTDDIAGNVQELLAEDRATVPNDKLTTAVFYSISNCQVGLRGVSFGSFLIKQVAQDLQTAIPSLKRFVTLSPLPGFRRWLNGQSERDEVASLLSVMEQADWLDRFGDELADLFLPLAAEYLLVARRSDGRPVDPVARFHLGNGARLERINWRADSSEKGVREAAGLMVNYLYDLSAIETNHEAYEEEGRIACAKAVRTLLPPELAKKTDQRKT